MRKNVIERSLRSIQIILSDFESEPNKCFSKFETSSKLGTLSTCYFNEDITDTASIIYQKGSPYAARRAQKLFAAARPATAALKECLRQGEEVAKNVSNMFEGQTTRNLMSLK